MSLFSLQRILGSLRLPSLALSPQERSFISLPIDGIPWTGSGTPDCSNISGTRLLNLDASQKRGKLLERPLLKRGFLF